MEGLEDKIRRFLSISSGYGYGYGYGYGDGSGFGDGSGSGYGDGYGDGSGSGYDDGSGDGSGDGYGYGKLKSYNHRKVYYIDDIPTLIDSVRRNVARGCIVNKDKTTTSCFIVRVGNYFAHGETLKAAYNDAHDKYMSNMSEEDRIAEFIKAHPDASAEYPCEDLFKWHNTLTGSCEFGRRQFCKDNGIDLNDNYTVTFFLDITKSTYGGNVIRKVIEEYKAMGS